MRTKKISITSILALILAFAMVIGIFSNLIGQANMKSNALVLIGCVVIWYFKPFLLNWATKISEKNMTRILTGILLAIVIIQILKLESMKTD